MFQFIITLILFVAKTEFIRLTLEKRDKAIMVFGNKLNEPSSNSWQNTLLRHEFEFNFIKKRNKGFSSPSSLV